MKKLILDFRIASISEGAENDFFIAIGRVNEDFWNKLLEVIIERNDGCNDDNQFNYVIDDLKKDFARRYPDTEDVELGLIAATSNEQVKKWLLYCRENDIKPAIWSWCHDYYDIDIP
jgi:hypothetical protein